MRSYDGTLMVLRVSWMESSSFDRRDRIIITNIVRIFKDLVFSVQISTKLKTLDVLLDILAIKEMKKNQYTLINHESSVFHI